MAPPESRTSAISRKHNGSNIPGQKKEDQPTSLTSTLHWPKERILLEPCAGCVLIARGTNPEGWVIEPEWVWDDWEDWGNPVYGNGRWTTPLDNAIENSALLIISPGDLSIMKQYGVDLPGVLLKDISDYARKYVDMTEDELFLSSSYVLLSYLQDSFTALPFLRYRGDTGTGKTRAHYVFGTLQYKVLCAGGSATTAGMRRLLDKWRGSLAIDEADFSTSDEKSDITKMLNARNEVGEFSNYIACDKNDPSEVDVLRLFGSTALATRKSFQDKALEGRCLTINMKETSRDDIPPNLGQSFRLEREILRARLTAFRIVRKFEGWEPEPLTAPDWGGLVNLEPRLKQIFEPLMQTMVDDRTTLMAFMERHRTRIIDERAGSWTGLVVSALYEICVELGEDEFTPGRVAEWMVVNELVQKATSQSVGRECRSLGLNPSGREAGTGRVLYKIEEEGNLDVLRSVFRRYIPDYEENRELESKRKGVQSRL